MPDISTALLDLVLQQTGGNENFWGDIANANFAKLENAVAAATPIFDIGGTVTILDSVARTAILDIQSGLTSDLTLVLPARSKSWFVRNATSGSYKVFLKTPAQGTPVEIAQGTAQAVFCNGDAIYSAAPPAQTVLAAPIGSVHFWTKNAAPTGYLECDGAAVSRTVYASLFAVIGTAFGAGDTINTFNLPDLRGEFLRGWDHGKGTDAGRALGSTQTDNAGSHTHGPGTLTGTTDSQGAHTHNAGFNLGRNTVSGGDLAVMGGTDSRPTTSAGAHTHAVTLNGGATGDSSESGETRPRNVALMAIIRAL